MVADAVVARGALADAPLSSFGPTLPRYPILFPSVDAGRRNRWIAAREPAIFAP